MDVPIVVDAALLHNIQNCSCISGFVNVLQWNGEWFFSRRVKFDSGFKVMAVYEVSWHGPKVIYRFTGIRKWQVGIHNTCSNVICGAFPLIWVSKVLVWHHCHHVIANFWTRQSRLSLFFPRAFIFSIVTTIACCPFHWARATFTTADGKVAKSARGCPLGPSRCFATCSWFQWRFALLFFVLPVFLFLILLDWFCTWWHVPGGFRQPSRNVSSSVAEIWRSCSYVKLFLGSHCPSFQVSAPFSTIYSGYAWARSKSVTSWCVECAFHNVDNDSTNLLKHWFVVLCCWVHVRVCFQANPPSDLSSFGAAFVVAYHMSGWVCQWKLFGRVWTFWRTEHCRCPCAPQQRSQWLHPCDSQDFETIRFSTLGAHEASR